MTARSGSLSVFQLGSGPSRRLEVEHRELEYRGGTGDRVGIGEAGVDERWGVVAIIMEE